MSESVRLTRSGGVAQLQLCEPESRNALSDGLRAGLMQALDTLTAADDLQALVLTGSDGVFCAGGDLKNLLRQKKLGKTSHTEALLARMQKLHRWLRQLRDLPVPVIVAVDGPAYGAGLGLALTGDIILATDRATFCAPFCKIGAVPDGNLFWSLPRMVGLQRARELFYTGRVVEAQEAQRIGICMEVLPADELLPRATAMAHMMCDASPEAFALTKQISGRSLDLDSDALMALEAQAQALSLASEYHFDAIERFANKEKLKFDFR